MSDCSIGEQIQRGGVGEGVRPPLPGKSQVDEGTGTDPLEKQLDPLGPIASRGRFVRPSVKNIDD